MSPALVVTLILVVGIGLVVLATLADRRSALRAAGRPAVARDPEGAAPAYLTADDLIARAPQAAALTPGDERDLAKQLAQASTVQVACALATETLATHTGVRAILDAPRVLVCADQVAQLRELLALLAAASAERTPLLIAAPAIDAETLETLVANKLAGTLALAVVLGPIDALDALATASNAPMVGFIDRQAGAVSLGDLGQAQRVIADTKSTWIIPTG